MAKISDWVDHGGVRGVHYHGMRSHLPSHLLHLALFDYLTLRCALIEYSWHTLKARIMIGIQIIIHAGLRTAQGLPLVEALFN